MAGVRRQAPLTRVETERDLSLKDAIGEILNQLSAGSIPATATKIQQQLHLQEKVCDNNDGVGF